MIVLRLAGWLLLLAGLSVLAGDVVAWSDTRTWTPIALGQLWYELDPPSLNLAQAATQRYPFAFLWDRLFAYVLQCWASVALMALGAAILLLARRRRARRA